MLSIVQYSRVWRFRTVDRDHINRYQDYIDILRTKITGNTGQPFDTVSGILVADKLSKKPNVLKILDRLAKDDMKALEWKVLLELASKQWDEFLDILIDRAPDDERLSELCS